MINSEEFRLKMEVSSMLMLALQKDREWANQAIKLDFETYLHKIITSIVDYIDTNYSDDAKSGNNNNEDKRDPLFPFDDQQL